MGNDYTCRVCGAPGSEHYDEDGKLRTQHVPSSDGRLETEEEQRKRLRGVESRPTVTLGAPQTSTTGYQETPATRLAEVLVNRGLIDDKDLLYVIGLGERPWDNAQMRLI